MMRRAAAAVLWCALPAVILSAAKPALSGVEGDPAAAAPSAARPAVAKPAFGGPPSRPSGLGTAVAARFPGLATSLRAGPKTIKTASGVEMIYLPGGSFTMGDAKGAPDEKPHKVSVDAFYMDKYEVTQEHYRKIVGSDYSRWKNPQAPTEQVTWAAAVKYCNTRSRAEGLTPCYDTTSWKCNFAANGYRLPTEAEWEYAARAGTTTSYSFRDNASSLRNFAWTKENSGGRPREVGKKLPNPWGLYDIYGNVAEWCNDFYAVDYYQNSPARNPRGPASGSKRAVRGGSWNSRAPDCRSSYRAAENPAYADVCIGYYDVYGFRCVRSATPGKPR